ncbi:hypothetical protein F4778DRAFT_447121 [Xylariomycetidae sp. FL2044]|nr:hypothetical protein F4778DRAFT_447121 [Xylariomycetidae sp. FL2044]
MADNLRKKLEQLKPLESELKSLQHDRVDYQRAAEELNNARLRIETLKRESEAYASKMQGYEIEIADFRDQKAVMSTQNAELRLRLADLEQRSQVDEAVVKDLQEKVMMLDPSATPSTPTGLQPASLEDELSGSSDTFASMRNLEIQRLQAENAVLKSSIGSEAGKGQLVQEMEDMRISRQTLQDKYNEIFEKYTVGQHQLDTLINNMGKDGLVKTIQACYDNHPDGRWLMSDYFRQEAYSNLRTQVLAEQNNAKQFERQLAAVKEQLADNERALLEARGDLDAAEKSSIEALDELKRTDGMLAVSLRAELEAERRKYKSLKDESDAMQKQLLAAFIDKDELRREAEQANRELQKAADGQTVSTDSAKQSEKMEKLRARYKQLQQDIIKNLQRENAMIATAWYDLTSRLQSNHVVLQRRQDVPKSWLNKQRHMVNATPRSKKRDTTSYRRSRNFLLLRTLSSIYAVWLLYIWLVPTQQRRRLHRVFVA